MAMISKIGRRSLKVRGLYFAMYAFLALGAVSMVYPFLLMMAGSTKGAVDIKYFNAVPRFLRDDLWLYRRHSEALFNERALDWSMAYDEDVTDFARVIPPWRWRDPLFDQWQRFLAASTLPQGATCRQLARSWEECLGGETTTAPGVDDPFAEARRAFLLEQFSSLAWFEGRGEDAAAAADRLMEQWQRRDEGGRPSVDISGRVSEWERFLEAVELPPYAYMVGHMQATVSKTTPMHLRRFKKNLRDRYGHSIEDVNRELGTRFLDWNGVVVGASLVLSRRNRPLNTPFGEALYAYQSTVPYGQRVYCSVDGFFKKLYLKSQYTTAITNYNALHGTDYLTYDDVHLSRRYPAGASEAVRRDWESFVRDTLSLAWIRADDTARPAYHRYLRARHGTIETLNKNYAAEYGRFEEIPLVTEPIGGGQRVSDWAGFITGWLDPGSGTEHKIDVGSLRVHSVEFMFKDWLNAQRIAAGRAPIAEEQFVRLPQKELHRAHYETSRGRLKREFMTRNYRTVADYLLLHGRGVINTVIYCSLAILLALTVNPLAAYAMSRYKMPSTYKILLFLMCTMAFPPMVTQIPNFLMLRRFGLLNTFAALVLPGMANGYAIFLLKGFFDSQPRELYEAAQLDGASEWTIFWQITMSLSKPILAVIALQAFTMAYSNFMFAFVVCQDQKMWTLMVWLYQLQQRSGQAVVYASLIIAAVPTFIIFLFCQNIIMRGIVVPSEK